jgi:hypothetical protein
MGCGLLKPLVDPPKVPPAATFKIRKIFALNGHASPAGRSLGVTVKNGDPGSSTKNCMMFGDQITP